VLLPQPSFFGGAAATSTLFFMLCQGIEIVFESFLLLLDYDTYNVKLKKPMGHDLENISTAVTTAFTLKRLHPAVASELKVLNRLYATNLLRYGSFYDVLVDPATIRSDRTMRRMYAGLRLAQRVVNRTAPSNTPLQRPSVSDGRVDLKPR